MPERSLKSCRALQNCWSVMDRPIWRNDWDLSRATTKFSQCGLSHFYLSRAFAGLDRTADAKHEAALHQLMMQQLTFARSLESEQREGAIRPQVQQLLAANRQDAAVQLYQEHFKGTPATLADAYVFIG